MSRRRDIITLIDHYIEIYPFNKEQCLFDEHVENIEDLNFWTNRLIKFDTPFAAYQIDSNKKTGYNIVIRNNGMFFQGNQTYQPPKPDPLEWLGTIRGVK